MGAVWFIGRAELRRRWGSVIVLAVLVGISGGAVLATVAGARRTASAMDRFERESRTATFEVNVGQYTPDQVRALRQVPVVEGVGVLWQVSLYKEAAGFLPIAAPDDRSFGNTVDRGRIVRGRAATGVHELTIGEGLTEQLGVGVGDDLTFLSFTQEQIDSTIEEDFVPRGPEVTFHIVGIVRRPLDLGVRGEVGGVVVPTRAFLDEYRDRIGSFSGAVLRVRTVNGEADSAVMATATKRIFGPDVDFESLGLEGGGGARSAIDVMTAGLWILASITAVAATVAVGLALARRTTDALGEQDALASLGVRRSQRWGAATLPAVPIAIGGATLAAIVAFAASPIFPLGIAADAEVDPGFAADAAVLLLGALGLAAGVLGLGALAALLASRRVPAETTKPGTWSRAIAGADVPPTVGVGVAFALERGRGRRAVPVGSAIAAAILAVTGVVAAVSFAASLDGLVSEPSRYGWTWDYGIEGISAGDGCSSSEELGRDPAVEAVAAACYSDVTIDGRPSIAWAFAQGERGRLDPAIVEGRLPENNREAALGADLMRRLDRGLGDTVRFNSENGNVVRRIVGTFVIPPIADPIPLAESALLTPRALERGGEIANENAVVRVRDDADRGAFFRRVRALNGDRAPRTPTLPVEIERLRQIDALPFVLAVIIVLIGVIAVAYTLIVTIRRRAVDLAILKVLGFGRGQVRRTVAWQASTIGAIGIAVGGLLGLVTGQLVWRTVATDLGVGDALDIPVLGLVVLAPATLLLVNLIAALPARTAARTRPAVVLRSE